MDTTGEIRVLDMKLILNMGSKALLLKKMNVTIMKTTDKGAVALAASLIKSGQLIALPTDTIYGLACSANNPDAIKKLYEIKGRNEEKPVAICVSDLTDLRHWGEAQHLGEDMLKQLLPGPVTIVLKKSSHLDNPFLNPGADKIGIRIPDFNFIRDLCRVLRQPIALTSANRSSEASSLEIKEFSDLWPSLSAVFDGGALSEAEDHRAGSTVIDLSELHSCKVIRQGISYKSTMRIIRRHKIELE